MIKKCFKDWFQNSSTRQGSLPLLFTPRSDGFLTNSPSGTKLVKSIAPFYVATKGELEIYNGNPDYIVALTKLGYDSISLYSSAGGLELIKPLKEGLVMDIEDYIDLSLPKITQGLFHATDEFYTTFCHGDIGFHFGTEQAARDRKKVLDGPDVEVECYEFPDQDSDLLRFLKQEPTNIVEKVAQLVLSKVSHPDLNKVLGVCLELDSTELEEVSREYKNKPNSRAYEKLMNEISSTPITCKVGELNLSLSNEAQLRCVQGAVNHSFMKKSGLLLNNPYRMPDLGTWGLVDVLRHTDVLTASEQEQIQLTLRYEQTEEAYSLYHKFMNGHGFDGIVYENSIEDAGQDSFIVFSASQIVPMAHREKLFGNVFAKSNREIVRAA